MPPSLVGEWSGVATQPMVCGVAAISCGTSVPGDAGRCPREIDLLTLSPVVLQGTAISSEHISRHPPGIGAVLGGSPPPRRSLEQLDRLFPADPCSLSPRNASDGCIPHRLGSGHEWPPSLRPVEWPPSHISLINCLEMLAVFQALKHFLPDLRDRHVLVHADNTSVISYINHQEGLRSRPLFKLAHQILVWSQGKLLLLRAVYIPRHLYQGADEVVEPIWRVLARLRRYRNSSSSLGAGCHGSDMAEVASGISLLPLAPFWPGRVWFSDLISLLDGSPWRFLSGGISSHERVARFCIPARSCGSCGCAPEGAHLVTSGLSTEVAETILQSRAPSMRKLYAWNSTQSTAHWVDPLHLELYVAAIAAFYSPLGVNQWKNTPWLHVTRGMAASKAFSSG
ncbi:hypothetical protein M9458_012669, partial [Cirrhinus mrigala]